MAKHYQFDLGMDDAQADAVSGYIEGISTTISTTRYLDGVVEFASRQMMDKFATAVDVAAAAAKESFAHVYEWGDEYGDTSRVGAPQFRLWRMTSIGRGRRREIGFQFLPSKVPSPIEPELLEPGPNGQTVNEDVHIFTWKAPVMEYGMEVEIRPKLSKVKAMAFVDDETGEIIFRKTPIITVPGKDDHIGVFTGFYAAWWSQAAGQVFDQEIRPQLEADVISERALKKVAQATRRRRKGIDLTTVDYNRGKSMAEKHMKDNEIDYVRRAARRRRERYGY